MIGHDRHSVSNSLYVASALRDITSLYYATNDLKFALAARTDNPQACTVSLLHTTLCNPSIGARTSQFATLDQVGYG